MAENLKSKEQARFLLPCRVTPALLGLAAALLRATRPLCHTGGPWHCANVTQRVPGPS